MIETCTWTNAAVTRAGSDSAVSVLLGASKAGDQVTLAQMALMESQNWLIGDKGYAVNEGLIECALNPAYSAAQTNSTKVTTMDMSFPVSNPAAVPDNFVESFAANSKAQFAVTQGGGLSPNKVDANVTAYVMSAVGFSETVTADQTKQIMAGTVGLAASKVQVTAKAGARRLGHSRRLQSSNYDLKMEVASTAEAKSVATKSQDTLAIKESAANAGVTISEPTVEASTMLMDVKYAYQGEMTAPAQSELAALGSALGTGSASVSNFAVVSVPTPATEQSSGSHVVIIRVSIAVTMLASVIF
jgi:hypothetical protein